MSTISIKASRISKEIRQLNSGKERHGFNCELKDECLLVTFAGPKATVYENEKFELKVRFDEKYPFSPPRLQLVTGIYHPNIDKDGKICLNILNMPPEGTYNPTITIESLIVSVQLLISTPNPYDPLRADAASDFLLKKQIFHDKVLQQIEDNKKAGHTSCDTTRKRKYCK